MTALDDWSSSGSADTGEWWEWHGFCDGLAHLYPHAQLVQDWPPLVLPACELRRSQPRGHDRPSITPRSVQPHPDRMCPDCVDQTNPIPEVPRARR